MLLIEEKAQLMKRMGQKYLDVQLSTRIEAIPDALHKHDLSLSDDGQALTYSYDTRARRTGITTLLADVSAAGLVLRDVVTRQSSLEDIFVGLVHAQDEGEP